MILTQDENSIKIIPIPIPMTYSPHFNFCLDFSLKSSFNNTT